MAKAKLVRDKVPALLTGRGRPEVVRTAEPYEYAGLLRAKLVEEVEEFLDSEDPRELADVLEVLLELARVHGFDRDDLERLRADKVRERGGFTNRLVWSGNEHAA